MPHGTATNAAEPRLEAAVGSTSGTRFWVGASTLGVPFLVLIVTMIGGSIADPEEGGLGALNGVPSRRLMVTSAAKRTPIA